MFYYIICDNATQWFSYLIACKSESDGIVNDSIDMGSIRHIDSNILKNIYNRELTFRNKRLTHYSFNFDTFYGWNISQLEYMRIKRMIELMPYIQEFNNIKDFK